MAANGISCLRELVGVVHEALSAGHLRAIHARPVPTVTLSLISHTNIGKTTLARTLLRQDVGEVRDAPHVTA